MGVNLEMKEEQRREKNVLGKLLGERMSIQP
jgi:hypothetical protein